MKSFVLVALLGLCFSNLQAKEAPPPVMYQFLSQVLQLQPYLFTTNQEELKKNRARIQKHLNEMARQADGLKMVHRLNSPLLRISSENLLSQIKNTALAFDRGQLGYAQRMLRTTLYACSSCHAQVKSEEGALWRFQDVQLSGTPFQRAEFLYATRQYDEALRIYKSVVRQYASFRDVLEMKQSLERILAIRLRSQGNTKAAIKDLEEVVANPNLPPDMQKKIGEWSREIKKLKSSSTPNPERAKVVDLIRYAEKTFDPRTNSKTSDLNKADAFFLSGLLFEHIRAQKTDTIAPEVLYWLAMYENSLGESLPFELAQLYLRECVRQNPASPVAVDCFNEYEEELRLDFTGSAGEDVPQDVEQEIKSLRKILKRK